jgi:hypothetical protein
MRLLNTGLVFAATLAAAACGGKLPGVGGLPGGGGNVDPNSCGDYASTDVGGKLKYFLTTIKDLDAAMAETTNTVKEACTTMGKELGMADADLAGDDTKAVCDKVIKAYQDNLQVSLKAGAKLAIKYSPGHCEVNVQAEASASGACSGAASAGTGGTGADAACQASVHAEASIKASCTPPSLTLEADAKVVVDKSKLEMTLKAMRDGLPKLLAVADKIKPIAEAVTNVVKAAASLKDEGQKLVSAFKTQAMCMTGQIAASVAASAHIQANVNVSVSVSASASGSVAGNAGG